MFKLQGFTDVSRLSEYLGVTKILSRFQNPIVPFCVFKRSLTRIALGPPKCNCRVWWPPPPFPTKQHWLRWPLNTALVHFPGCRLHWFSEILQHLFQRCFRDFQIFFRDFQIFSETFQRFSENFKKKSEISHRFSEFFRDFQRYSEIYQRFFQRFSVIFRDFPEIF